MLILTRRIGESLMVGDDVRISVLGVKGNQVRLGVKAPRSVTVHREEIFEKIRKEFRSREQARAVTTPVLESVTEAEE